jgi:hypothetical protein
MGAVWRYVGELMNEAADDSATVDEFAEMLARGLSGAGCSKMRGVARRQRKPQFSYEGFEVWARARMIAQYPPISLQSDADHRP